MAHYSWYLLSLTLSLSVFLLSPPPVFALSYFFGFALTWSAAVRGGLIHAKMKSIETQGILK